VLINVILQASNVNASGYFALGSIWRCNSEEGWSNGYGLAQCLLHVQQFLSVFMADVAALEECTDLEDELWGSYPSLATMHIPVTDVPEASMLKVVDVVAKPPDNLWMTVVGGKHRKAFSPTSPSPHQKTTVATSSSALLDALHRSLHPLGDLLDGSDLAVIKHVCGEHSVSNVNADTEFRCWYTGLSCSQDTICLPISYSRNPKTRKVKTSCVWTEPIWKCKMLTLKKTHRSTTSCRCWMVT
jgi:hypothetical protein